MPTRTDKPLMRLTPSDLGALSKKTATGLGFSVVKDPQRELFWAVVEDGRALPLQRSTNYFDVLDLIAGEVPPGSFSEAELPARAKFFTQRSQAIAALKTRLSPNYLGQAGASPLVLNTRLQKGTSVFRFVGSSIDHRYVGGSLTAGSYVTSDKDYPSAPTGLSAVGRYALPLPIPASHLFEYQLDQGTAVSIGTVAPNFGQAGGGVEIRLNRTVKASLNRSTQLPDF